MLLLPPDPACSVANQMRAGGKLGAEVLVVIAGATNENLASVASSTTTSIFTGNFPNSEPQPTILVDKSVHITTGQRENGPNSEQTGQSRKTAGGRGARGGDPGGRVLGSEARRTIISGPSATVPEAPPTGDACPPLTVVVGHEEGKRILEWFRGVRSAVEGGSMGGDDGGGVVTASLAERENVGRLWGDVLWASDPRNWPAGGWVGGSLECFAARARMHACAKISRRPVLLASLLVYKCRAHNRNKTQTNNQKNCGHGTPFICC